ncbi:MAG: DsbA family protein [Pseudomonadota bacterium]
MKAQAGVIGGGLVVAALFAIGIVLAGFTPAPVDRAPKPVANVTVPAADVSQLFSETDITPEQREVLQAEMRRYLLTNPDVITEVVTLLEARRAAETAQAELSMVSDNAPEIFADGFSYIGGNPNGAVTVVEFLDYRCGFCKRAHSDVMTLIERNDDIRYIVKEYPILGPESVTAARAALAVLDVAGEEVYAEFNDLLMKYGGPINDQVIQRFADRAGADVTEVFAAMQSPEIERQIRRNHELGRALDVTGTPTFIFGEQIVRGFVPLEQMEEAVALVRRIVE